MIDSILNPYELKGLDYFYETADYAEKLGVRWKIQRKKVHSFDEIYGEVYIIGNCLFHRGISPSFYLFNENTKEGWDINTFSCKSYCSFSEMDIFSFIMEMTGCNHNEAVKRFANFVGVEVFLGEMD